MLSAVTIGAAASKKLRLFAPHFLSISEASSPSVSGPVAITVMPLSGTLSAVFSITFIFLWDFIFSVTIWENILRSTASAPPAATDEASAALRQTEPKRRISSFKSPAAESMREALSEFEQTSSAKFAL